MWEDSFVGGNRMEKRAFFSSLIFSAQNQDPLKLLFVLQGKDDPFISAPDFFDREIPLSLNKWVTLCLKLKKERYPVMNLLCKLQFGSVEGLMNLN